MKNEKGHTLIELVFVVVLIGVSFPGLLGFFTNNVVDSINNEIISKATIFAHIKMEQITADKRDKSKGLTFINTPYRYPSETLDRYTRTVTVRKKTISGISGLEVIVTVQHALLKTDYTLTHFFTNQEVY